MCLAIPGRLTAIQGDGDLRVGEVDFGGVSRDANLAFVPEAVVGDYVLVMREDWTLLDWMEGEQRHRQLGVHAGVSADEMLVPLVVAHCAR